MKNFHRVTVWCQGYIIATDLGLVPDKNSRTDCAEWYFTFEDIKDVQALVHFFCLSQNDPTKWVAHAISFWPNDPRLNRLIE